MFALSLKILKAEDIEIKNIEKNVTICPHFCIVLYLINILS